MPLQSIDLHQHSITSTTTIKTQKHWSKPTSSITNPTIIDHRSTSPIQIASPIHDPRSPTTDLMILFQWLIFDFCGWFLILCLWECVYQRKKEHDKGENALVLEMGKREEKRSELDIIKILNARATVTVHIYMVIVALVYLCTILHPLMWVFFCSKCVTFSILQDFTHVDADSQRAFPSIMWTKLTKERGRQQREIERSSRLDLEC